MSLGALAVDPELEAETDTGLTLMLDDAVPATDPDRMEELVPQTGGGAADTATSADSLPEGFILEDIASAAATARQPPYRPFDELTLTRRTPLAYPTTAPRRRSGSVEVSFTVSESGDVTDVTAESDLEAVFIEAAQDTIARWRFVPVAVDGVPTAVRSAIRVTFRD